MIELIQNIFIHHNYLVISDYNDEFQIRYKLVNLKLSIEATVHKSFIKELYSQECSQEWTCVEVSFLIKLEVLGLQPY